MASRGTPITPNGPASVPLASQPAENGETKCGKFTSFIVTQTDKCKNYFKNSYGGQVFLTVSSTLGGAAVKVFDGLSTGYGHLCKAGTAVKEIALETPRYANRAFGGALWGLGGGYALGGATGVAVGLALVAAGIPGIVLAVPTAIVGGVIGSSIGGVTGASFGATIQTFRQYRNSWFKAASNKDEQIKSLEEQLKQLRTSCRQNLHRLAEEGRTASVSQSDDGLIAPQPYSELPTAPEITSTKPEV